MGERIIDIVYGEASSDRVKIKISEEQSVEQIEEALREFKKTDEYKDGDWCDDDLIEHLESCAIEFEHIPFVAEETIRLFDL